MTASVGTGTASMAQIFFNACARCAKAVGPVSQPKDIGMRTGSKSEKRPADVVGNAVQVTRIATGLKFLTISN
jgi:hypothetical protein